MKRFLALVALALLCTACAQGGSVPSSGDGGSLDMYGTVDEGITFRH